MLAAARCWALVVVDAGPLDARCCCGRTLLWAKGQWLVDAGWSLDVEEKNQKMQARRTRRMQHLREREIREKNRSRSRIAAAALEGLREREIRESE